MMRKLLSLALGLLLALWAFPVSAAALSPYQIASDVAVLMDADTGQVLFAKNMDQKAYPASTTKIMTCLLASELRKPLTTLTVSQSAVDIPEWNSANISLIPGEKLTMNDALYGMMLSSANDAANVIAEHVGGSQEGFNEMMNQRAWQMGAYNTRFVNAHGLHSPGHYTTGYDLALITRYAIQNKDFMHYFGGTRHSMPGTNRQPAGRSFYNYQSMLMDDTAYYDPGVTGGKVGYTTEAQHTMSTSATRDGRTLVCVVMYSTERTQKFTDTALLLDYGFSQFKQVSVPAAAFDAGPIPYGDEEVSFYSGSGEDFTALLPLDMDESSLQIEFGLPARFESGQTLPAAFDVAVDSQDPTFPEVLGSYAIACDLPEMQSAPAPEPAPFTPFFDPNAAPVTAVPLLVAALILSGLALVLLGLILFRYNSLRQRRRSRIKALGRRVETRRKERQSA